MSYGIDYGLRQTNIDPANGIRYGVIHHNVVGQAWYEESLPFYPDDSDDYTEPDGWYIQGEIVAYSDSYGDIFVTKSPYYTHARFCSPCAPGACSLNCPTDKGGPRAYCFGADWFVDWPCPYPVYRVTDGVCIYTPKG